MNPLRISSCTLNGISDFFGLVRFCLVYNFHLKRGFFPLSSLRGNQIIWRGKSLAEGGLIISIAFYSVSGILWHCKGMAKLIGVAIWESLQYIKKIVSGKIALQSAFYSDRQWSGRIPISFSSSFSLHRTRKVKGGFHIWSPQKFWSFWPPPLSLRKLFILSVHKFGVFFDPLPLLCGRHIWKPPKRETQKLGGEKDWRRRKIRRFLPPRRPMPNRIRTRCSKVSGVHVVFSNMSYSLGLICGIEEGITNTRFSSNTAASPVHSSTYIPWGNITPPSSSVHGSSSCVCQCLPTGAWVGQFSPSAVSWKTQPHKCDQMWPDVTRCDQMWPHWETHDTSGQLPFQLSSLTFPPCFRPRARFHFANREQTLPAGLTFSECGQGRAEVA